MKFLKLFLLGSLLWSVESFSLQPPENLLNVLQSSESDSDSIQSSESELNLAKPHELTGFFVKIAKVYDDYDTFSFCEAQGNFSDQTRYIRRDEYAVNFFRKIQSVLTRNQFKNEVQSFCTEILSRMTVTIPDEVLEESSKDLQESYLIESGLVRKEDGQLQVNKELFNKFVTRLVREGLPLRERQGADRQYADFICPKSGLGYTVSTDHGWVEGMVSYSVSKKNYLSKRDGEELPFLEFSFYYQDK